MTLETGTIILEEQELIVLVAYALHSSEKPVIVSQAAGSTVYFPTMPETQFSICDEDIPVPRFAPMPERVKLRTLSFLYRDEPYTCRAGKRDSGQVVMTIPLRYINES